MNYIYGCKSVVSESSIVYFFQFLMSLYDIMTWLFLWRGEIILIIHRWFLILPVHLSVISVGGWNSASERVDFTWLSAATHRKHFIDIIIVLAEPLEAASLNLTGGEIIRITLAIELALCLLKANMSVEWWVACTRAGYWCFIQGRRLYHMINSQKKLMTSAHLLVSKWSLVSRVRKPGGNWVKTEYCLKNKFLNILKAVIHFVVLHFLGCLVIICKTARKF